MKQNEKKGLQNKPTMNYENKCYRCGMKGHLSRTCCMPKKYKENRIEMNFANHNNPIDSRVFLDSLNEEGNTHLDVSNFFVNSNTKTNILIGNDNVYNN